MALSFKARKRWSLVALLIGMPLYIIVAVSLVSMFNRPPILLELAIYIGLGLVWILPLKALIRGVGKPDPDLEPDPDQDPE